MRKTPEAPGKIEEEITREKYGRNISQRDIYYRHGKKLPTGELAPEGFEQARVIGKELKPATVKPYVSEVKRAKDFGEAIQKATESRREYKIRTRHDISLTKEGKLIHSKEHVTKVKNTIKEKGEDEALQCELDFGKERPDLETLSPCEIAAKFARHVLTHVRMPERYYNESKVEMVNVTHAPNLMSFLKYGLGEQIEQDPINPKGKTFIEKMGGVLKPAESFEIDTTIGSEGDKLTKLKIRGKEYDLSEERLEELASAAKEL